MVEFGYWASFAAGIVLILAAGLGFATFARRARNASTKASGTLSWAIALGFLSMGANALYWQVYGQVGQYFGIITLPTVRLVGSYFDVVFKGTGALAAYLHLLALWQSLDPEERKRWSVLGMVTYPDETGLLARLLNGMGRGK